VDYNHGGILIVSADNILSCPSVVNPWIALINGGGAASDG